MSKTRLQLNKDTISALALTVGVFMLILINIVILTPKLINVYFSKGPATENEPIDTVTVNEAMKVINAP